MNEYLQHQMEKHNLTPILWETGDPLIVSVSGWVKDQESGEEHEIQGSGATHELAVEEFCEKLAEIGS